MFLRKHWDVLLVDDEPDVLAVSKLALKSIDCYGIPLRIHTCASAKEAVAFLENKTLIPDLAVAIIDVVMESDEAGLELCRHIRETMKNTVTQLIIRTGQAGKAPERAVIDRYDITQYITKVEATEDRLYTILKSSLRQFLWARVSMGMVWHMQQLVGSSSSRANVFATVQHTLESIFVDKNGKPVDNIAGHFCFFIDDETISLGDYKDVGKARGVRDGLRSATSVKVNDAGDELRRQGQDVLLRLAPQPGGALIELVARTSFEPLPEFFYTQWMLWLGAIRNALALAGNR